MKRILRFLFSRYFVCAIFIVIELFVMLVLFEYALAFVAAFSIIARVFAVLIFIGLINRDTNHEFKLAWIALAAVAPVFGSALYLIFSSKRLTRSEERIARGIGEAIAASKSLEIDKEISDKCLSALALSDPYAAGRAYAAMGCDSTACLFPNEGMRYYKTGEEMWEDMCREIELARRYVYLEYFIIEDGVMWQKIYTLLKQKAKEGVDVRIIYDDVGCIGRLPRTFCKELCEAGIDCRAFFPIGPTLLRSHNNRDHRKILAIDGTVAFTGGINVADEYINVSHPLGHWKDGGVMVRGAAARGFVRMFLISYDLAAHCVSDYDAPFIPHGCGDSRENGTQTEGGFVMPISSGPAPLYANSQGRAALMNMINGAARSLYITTPYLIIDYGLTEALKYAALRGVDVRIITPGVPDKRIINVMTKSSYESLCKAGVRIFEYTPGFMHGKVAIADGKCALVGSINLDYRSLAHHFEDALAIYSCDTVADITTDFYATLEKCTEASASSLPLGAKAVATVMRIIAPLL